MDVESFWLRVKELIKKRNSKQETIAVSCGISYRTFQTWINRKTYPDAQQTVLIAHALGTTVEYLVTGELNDRDMKLRECSEALCKVSKDLSELV